MTKLEKTPNSERIAKKTHEDDKWDYGHYVVDGAEMPHLTWMQLKNTSSWINDDFKTVVRTHFKIPLNDEMLKQITKYEGDYDFLWSIYMACFFCKAEPNLTEKQINFIARMYIPRYNIIHPIIFNISLVSSLVLNITTKEIEKLLQTNHDRLVLLSCHLTAAYEDVRNMCVTNIGDHTNG